MCMNREKHFAPAGVYDHLGEIYSSLIIIGSITVSLLFLKVSYLFIGHVLLFFHLLYCTREPFNVITGVLSRSITYTTVYGLIISFIFELQGYTYPSSSDWGSTGNVLVDFYWVWKRYMCYFFGWHVFVLFSIQQRLHPELYRVFFSWFYLLLNLMWIWFDYDRDWSCILGWVKTSIWNFTSTVDLAWWGGVVWLSASLSDRLLPRPEYFKYQ